MALTGIPEDDNGLLALPESETMQVDQAAYDLADISYALHASQNEGEVPDQGIPEEKGYSALGRLLENTHRVGTAMVEGAADLATSSARVNPAHPTGALSAITGEALDALATKFGRSNDAKSKYERETSFEGLLKTGVDDPMALPGYALKFAKETAVDSVPDIAGMAIAPELYAVGAISEGSKTRAQNNGRDTRTVGDVAGGVGVAISRMGAFHILKKLYKGGKLAKGVVIKSKAPRMLLAGVTEAFDEGGEIAATNWLTERGLTQEDLKKAMLEGFGGGLILGAPITLMSKQEKDTTDGTDPVDTESGGSVDAAEAEAVDAASEAGGDATELDPDLQDQLDALSAQFDDGLAGPDDQHGALSNEDLLFVQDKIQSINEIEDDDLTYEATAALVEALDKKYPGQGKAIYEAALKGEAPKKSDAQKTGAETAAEADGDATADEDVPTEPNDEAGSPPTDEPATTEEAPTAAPEVGKDTQPESQSEIEAQAKAFVGGTKDAILFNAEDTIADVKAFLRARGMKVKDMNIRKTPLGVLAYRKGAKMNGVPLSRIAGMSKDKLAEHMGELLGYGKSATALYNATDEATASHDAEGNLNTIVDGNDELIDEALTNMYPGGANSVISREEGLAMRAEAGPYDLKATPPGTVTTTTAEDIAAREVPEFPRTLQGKVDRVVDYVTNGSMLINPRGMFRNPAGKLVERNATSKELQTESMGVLHLVMDLWHDLAATGHDMTALKQLLHDTTKYTGTVEDLTIFDIRRQVEKANGVRAAISLKNSKKLGKEIEGALQKVLATEADPQRAYANQTIEQSALIDEAADIIRSKKEITGDTELDTKLAEAVQDLKEGRIPMPEPKAKRKPTTAVTTKKPKSAGEKATKHNVAPPQENKVKLTSNTIVEPVEVESPAAIFTKALGKASRKAKMTMPALRKQVAAASGTNPHADATAALHSSVGAMQASRLLGLYKATVTKSKRGKGALARVQANEKADVKPKAKPKATPKKAAAVKKTSKGKNKPMSRADEDAQRQAVIDKKRKLRDLREQKEAADKPKAKSKPVPVKGAKEKRKAEKDADKLLEEAEKAKVTLEERQAKNAVNTLEGNRELAAKKTKTPAEKTKLRKYVAQFKSVISGAKVPTLRAYKKALPSIPDNMTMSEVSSLVERVILGKDVSGLTTEQNAVVADIEAKLDGALGGSMRTAAANIDDKTGTDRNRAKAVTDAAPKLVETENKIDIIVGAAVDAGVATIDDLNDYRENRRELISHPGRAAELTDLLESIGVPKKLISSYIEQVDIAREVMVNKGVMNSVDALEDTQTREEELAALMAEQAADDAAALGEERLMNDESDSMSVGEQDFTDIYDPRGNIDDEGNVDSSFGTFGSKYMSNVLNGTVEYTAKGFKKAMEMLSPKKFREKRDMAFAMLLEEAKFRTAQASTKAGRKNAFTTKHVLDSLSKELAKNDPLRLVVELLRRADIDIPVYIGREQVLERAGDALWANIQKGFGGYNEENTGLHGVYDASVYSNEDAHIFINQHLRDFDFKDEASGDHDFTSVATVVHEMLHAATVIALHQNPVFRAEIRELMNRTETVIDLFGKADPAIREALELAGDRYAYAMKNEEEFISVGISDGRLNNLLSLIPGYASDTINNRGDRRFNLGSLFDRMMKAIYKALGTKNHLEESALTSLIRSVSNNMTSTAEQVAYINQMLKAEADAKNKIGKSYDRSDKPTPRKLGKYLNGNGENINEVYERWGDRGLKMLYEVMPTDTMNAFYGKYETMVERVGKAGNKFTERATPIADFIALRYKRSAMAAKFHLAYRPLINRGQELLQSESAADTKTFSNVVTESTAYDVNLAQPFPEKWSTKKKPANWDTRKAAHARLAPKLNAMPKYKAYYTQLDKFFKEHHRMVRDQEIANRAEAWGVKPSFVKRLVAADTKEKVEALLHPAVPRMNKGEVVWKAMPDAQWDSIKNTILQYNAKLTGKEGFYFPLMRFGSVFMSGNKKATSEVYYSKEDARDAASDFRAEAYGNKTGKLKGSDKAGWTFQKSRPVEMLVRPKDVAKMRKQLTAEGYGELSVTEKVAYDKAGNLAPALATAMRRLNRKGKGEEARTLEAAVIDMMPENAAAKRMMHRAGVYGATQNIDQSLATYVQTAGWNIAALKYNSQMQQSAKDMKYLARNDKSGNQMRLSLVTNNLVARSEQGQAEMGNLGQWAGKLAFINSLIGFSYPILNLTQTLMTTMPYLQGKYGSGRATRALAKAGYMIGRVPFTALIESKGGLEALFDSKKSKLSNVEGYSAEDTSILANMENVVLQVISRLQMQGHRKEAAMLTWLKDTVLLEASFSRQVLEVAKGGRHRGALSNASDVIAEAGSVMPFLGEIFNRTTTALATYDLAIKSGASEAKARAEVELSVRKTQFDYSKDNKPPLFEKNDFTRAATLFKIYPTLYAGFVYEQYYNGWKAKVGDKVTLDERKVARRTLNRIIATQLVATGIGGTIAIGPVKMAMGALSMLGSQLFGVDTDDPEEDIGFFLAHPKVALRMHFSDAFKGMGLDEEMSNHLARILVHGAPSGAGIDIAQRVGWENLFIAEAMTGETAVGRQVNAIVDSTLGPLLGINDGVSKFYNGIAQGMPFTKAVQYILPKLLKDVAKAAYRSQNGITDWKGSTLMDSTEFGPFETAVQVMGYNPDKAREMYMGRAFIRNRRRKVEASKKKLMRRWNEATPGERVRLVAEIRRFNKSLHPDEKQAYGINTAKIRSSMKSRAERQQRTRKGVYWKRGSAGGLSQLNWSTAP